MQLSNHHQQLQHEGGRDKQQGAPQHSEEVLKRTKQNIFEILLDI